MEVCMTVFRIASSVISPPNAFLIFFSIALFSVLVNRALQKKASYLIPDQNFSLLNLFDVAVEKLLALSESIMGHHDGKRFFPLMGALFIYILFSNLLGLIPGFLPPTDNLNTNVACALTVFIFYNYQGFKAHGFAYLKHFMGPIWWLAPIMVVIEVISHQMGPIKCLR